jgi:hypothetical protein
MVERVQRIWDAVNAILGNTVVAALTAWGSLGVICLVGLGMVSLVMAVIWAFKKPPIKEILKHLAYLIVIGLVFLINVALPAGLIAAIPGAGDLVKDLINAIIG